MAITRSMCKTNTDNNIKLKVDINFDEASQVWRKNKKYMGNGHFNYICLQLTKTGKTCNRRCKIGSLYCRQHLKTNTNYYNEKL